MQASGGRQDGFAVIEVKCPSCGAPLQIPETATEFTCGYCGSTLHVSRPRQVPSGVDADGTIRDRSTGYGLFRGQVPEGWAVAGTALERRGSSSRPYLPQVALEHAGNALMSIQMGDAGARQSAGMSMLTTFYSQAAAAYDTTNYAEMPSPVEVADALAVAQAGSLGGQGLALIAQEAPLSLEAARERSRADFSEQARMAGVMLSDFLGAQIVRTYGFTLGGAPWRMAVFVEAWAAKEGMGIGEGIGNVADAFGSLFGGLGSGLSAMVGQAQAGAQQLGQQMSQQLQGQQSAQQQGQQYGQQPTGQGQGAGGMLKSALDFTMGGGLIGKKMREARAAQQGQQGYQQTPGQQPYQQQTPQQQTPQQQGYQQVQASAQGTYAQSQQPYSQQAQAQQGYQQAQQPVPEQAPQQQVPTEQAQRQVPQADAWSLPDLASFNQGGTIFWSIDRTVALVAPADAFDQLFEGDFRQVAAGVLVHPDVRGLAMAVAQQESAAIQGSTQQALAANQAAFNAQQAAHRQQQAAFNAYNDSISAARDSRQASFRAATNAQFAGAPGGGHAPADYSEAIRGVNTYTTSDGREVEVSVHADRAYENQAGDVIGTSGSYDPGADWTEIPRS